MMRFRGLLPLVALGALAGSAPASAQVDVPVNRATELREHAGTVVFSRWDGTAYRLALLRGKTITDLPQVPPQEDPFDADIGSNSSGDPQVIVSLCEDTCDLFVVDLEPGARLRPVSNANTTDHDEHSPTVWRGRIAFARTYGDRDVPYTKKLVAPRSRPSDRLADLPDERCIASEAPTCRAIEDEKVTSLELWGRWVGQTWRYTVDDAGGFAQNEVRLTTVDRSRTRQLDFFTSGLGAQTALAPSFADGAMGWYVACLADTEGCGSRGTGGAYRYAIKSGAYARDVDQSQLGGWAWDGQFQWRSPAAESLGGCEPELPTDDYPPEPNCAITIAPQPDYEPIDAPEPVS